MTPVPSQRPRSWTLFDVSIVVAMVAVAAWAFRTPLRDIVAVAMKDDEQSHIVLAPIVAIWLVWLRRSRLALLGVSPNLFGPAMVAAGAILSWWGFRSDTYAAWHGGAVLAMLGMVVSITGPAVFRHFAPAIVALVFVVPVPGTIRQAIALPLQSMTTNVTATCLDAIGVQAVQMGNVLVINGEQVAVAEACNGMRLVFALTLVVYAFVYSTPLTTGTRLAMIALSPIVALAANIVRLVPTSVLYGVASPQQAEFFHDLSGWLMLPLTLIALLLALRMFRWLDLPVNTYRLAYR